MARQTAGNAAFDKTINVKEKKGQKTEGFYKGVKSVEGYGNVHSITINGEKVSFWGSGQLDYKLKTVPVGAMVYIVYNGMEKAELEIADKKGKVKKVTKDVHTFDVEFDPEVTG